MFETTCCFTLAVFEKLDFAVKVNSTDCFDKTIDCFPVNPNRIMLSGFNMFQMIPTNMAPLLNVFDHLVGLYKGGFTLLILE